MITEQIKNKYNREVFKGRWGYYPCSFEVYKKLKELNKVYMDALRRKAAWERWDRKDPHNRVIRKKIRNSEGETVGYQAPVPMPEPELGPFLKKAGRHSHWDKAGRYYKDEIEFDVIEFLDGDFNSKFNLIPEAYREARYPKDNPDDVKPLKLDLQAIDDLYRLI